MKKRKKGRKSKVEWHERTGRSMKRKKDGDLKESNVN